MTGKQTAQAVRARAAVAVQETPELRDVLRFDFPEAQAQTRASDPGLPTSSRSAALRIRLALWLEQPL